MSCSIKVTTKRRIPLTMSFYYSCHPFPKNWALRGFYFIVFCPYTFFSFLFNGDPHGESFRIGDFDKLYPLGRSLVGEWFLVASEWANRSLVKPGDLQTIPEIGYRMESVRIESSSVRSCAWGCEFFDRIVLAFLVASRGRRQRNLYLGSSPFKFVGRFGWSISLILLLHDL